MRCMPQTKAPNGKTSVLDHHQHRQSSVSSLAERVDKASMCTVKSALDNYGSYVNKFQHDCQLQMVITRHLGVCSFHYSQQLPAGSEDSAAPSCD